MAGLAELVRLVDLAETEGASRKPTNAIEFSPQVAQFFLNIIGLLEIFRTFHGIFRGETGDFLEHFWRNSGKIFRPFFGIFVARPSVMFSFALVLQCLVLLM